MASPNSSKRVIRKGQNKVAVSPRSKASRTASSGKLRMKGMALPPKDAKGVLDTKRNIFGGELIISGEMDGRLRAEIMATVKNVVSGKVGRTAKQAAVAMEKDRIVVRTAEPQPAIALGKKLHQAHKGGRLKIVWADDTAPVRVHWTTGK